jgi:hypothetical protein
MAYIMAFNESKELLDSLQESMQGFPLEFDHCFNYLTQEPSSHIFADLIGMLESTLNYYTARYDVVNSTFQENKVLAQQCYELSQQLPKTCGIS